MKKVLMLATTAAMIEQFNKKNIELLNEMGYVADVAGNFKEGNPISRERILSFQSWIRQQGGNGYHIPAVRRPGAVKQNLKAYQMIKKLLQENEYELVHVHTPIGSILGRVAAHKEGTPVMYTAHGFHFYNGAPLKNWLLYYPAEWLFSWWTDVLITINHEDYGRAKRHMHAKTVEHIPGVGVDTKMLASCAASREQKRKELHIPEDAFVLLSVGELHERKNHKVVIQALRTVKQKKIVYVIAGQGKLEGEYRELIRLGGLQDNVRLLGFREDIDELCMAADCFVHPSIREGFGIAPMEAMASGLPLIASNVNGMRDYMEDGRTGLCVHPKSVDEMARAVSRMFLDDSFRKKCGMYNAKKARDYDIQIVNERMKKIYGTAL